MLVDAMDMIREHIQNPEMRAEFGAEGIRLSFAFALIHARESVGMTQVELAGICGVSQAYISKLESGEANPTIGKLGSIFAAMWMEPTIGFGPLLPERPNATPTGAGTQQSAEQAPVPRPAPPVDPTVAGGVQSHAARPTASTVPTDD